MPTRRKALLRWRRLQLGSPFFRWLAAAPPRLSNKKISLQCECRLFGTKRTYGGKFTMSAFGGKADIGNHTRNLVAPQCALIRTEAGWPGNLNRFPVSVILVPSTFRMERSWSR